MESPIIGGVLAFLGGNAVALLNYGINCRVLKYKPELLASMSIVRQMLSVGYLVAVFFLARVLPWDLVPLLIGAAGGLTIPSILLAVHLSKRSADLTAKSKEPSEKGEDHNG